MEHAKTRQFSNFKFEPNLSLGEQIPADNKYFWSTRIEWVRNFRFGFNWIKILKIFRLLISLMRQLGKCNTESDKYVAVEEKLILLIKSKI